VVAAWAFTPSHHYASFATMPSLDEYRRKAPKYESEKKENEKEKKHRVIVRAYRVNGGWPVGFLLYVLFSHSMMRVYALGGCERYGHRYI
jgi:hypothetical protein